MNQFFRTILKTGTSATPILKTVHLILEKIDESGQSQTGTFGTLMGITAQDNHCHGEAEDPIGCIGIVTLTVKSVRISIN